MLHCTHSLQKKIREQEVALTETTKNNAPCTSNILHTPLFADLYDLAVRVPKTGTVGTHDYGDALYRRLAVTLLVDALRAQKSLKRARRCPQFTKK